MDKMTNYILQTMVSTSKFIVATKPLIAISNIELVNRLDKVQQEVDSKGGIDTMDMNTMYVLYTKLNVVLDEIASRN